jgi:formate hydrogenlyase transcriptional activator
MNAEAAMQDVSEALNEARQQAAATRDILQAIRHTRSTPQPVFDTIAAAALQLCGGTTANVFTFDGTQVHLAATTHAPSRPGGEDDASRRFPVPPCRDMAAPRAVLLNAVVEIPDVTTDPDYTQQAHATATGFRSILAVPLVHEGRPIGAIAVGRAQPGRFPGSHLALLQTFADQAVIAIENARLFNELEREVEAHRRSRATIAVLVDDAHSGTDALVGETAAMQRVRAQIAQVAPTDSTVLVQGETGTGKELVARAVHALSRRQDRPFIVVNCAALPHDLVESELFGHEKGAFTGAVQQRRGRFELADGGTLFLDEIGELPGSAQAKLLRALQSGEFERLGGRTLRVDVRVIAATHRDLDQEVAGGRFRADLYYRLNVFPITLAPLRERRADLPALARSVAARIAPRVGRSQPQVSPAFLAWAATYAWPGNVRELENLIERALIRDSTITPDGMGQGAAPSALGPADGDLPLDEVERAHIRRVLMRHDWRIEGPGGAAEVLGLHASTLRGRLRRLGIARP